MTITAAPRRPADEPVSDRPAPGEPSECAPSAAFASRPWRNWMQRHLEVPIQATLFRLPGGGRLVELGCGRGIALAPLAHRCRPDFLIGIDTDTDAVDIASATLTIAGLAGQVILGDICRLPLADRSVRLVVDFGTCYHVDDPAAAITEVERILEPGGIFVHETLLAQRLAHPRRGAVVELPWGAAPALTISQRAVLWSTRKKTPTNADVGGHETNRRRHTVALPRNRHRDHSCRER